MRNPLISQYWPGRRGLLLLAGLAGSLPSVAQSALSGFVAGRYQSFAEEGQYDEQPDATSAFIAEIELEHETERGDLITFKPYVRAELHEDGDTFPDLREAMYLTFGDDWEFRAGVGKVFWGVTESVHLVDIINQTDFQEDTDGEEKLGQPMLHLSLIRDWGTLDLFALPGFRERELPQARDRPSFGLTVDNDNAQFESDDEENHLDGAIRYSHTLDTIDLGLSYFNGTSREPRLSPNGAGTRLNPFYPLIEQVGIDVQHTSEEWLWKLEMISREDDLDSYTAAAGGFEYTFVGVLESNHDIGLIGEYLYDERDEEATTPFADDVLVGLRWVLNDEQSTEVLFGIISDLDDGGQALNVEATRRLGDSFKLNVDVRAFTNTDDDPQLDAFKDDSFARVELAWYF